MQCFGFKNLKAQSTPRFTCLEGFDLDLNNYWGEGITLSLPGTGYAQSDESVQVQLGES